MVTKTTIKQFISLLAIMYAHGIQLCTLTFLINYKDIIEHNHTYTQLFKSVPYVKPSNESYKIFWFKFT